MCRSIRQRDLCTNITFLQQAVGETQYDFLIMTFCDGILEDAELEIFFTGFDVTVMAALMKRLLNITFESSSRIDILNEDTRAKIVLRNYALFELGLSQNQLEKLESHFEFALRDAWMDEELVHECKERFSDLRKVFRMEGKDFEYAAKTNRALATQILAVSS